MTFTVPEAMRLEHEELHEELSRALAAGGAVGSAASAVADALHAHFEKEEEYALPPLGALSLLAGGQITPEMAALVPLTERLKADLPHMLMEHQAITAALHQLIAVAQAVSQPEIVRFAHKLILHAQTEEQLAYPAAILIGEYLKLRLPQLSPAAASPRSR